MYKLLILFFASQLIFSQSANLDRKAINVSYVRLPSKPILEDSHRTYQTNISELEIKGLTKISDDATLTFNYNFIETSSGTPDVKKVEKEIKDKEGNVKSIKYSYKVVNSFESYGIYKFKNVDTNNSFETKLVESDDYESKWFDTYDSAKDYYNSNRGSIRDNYSKKHQEKILNKIINDANVEFGYYPINKSIYLLTVGSKKHPEYEAHKAAYLKIKEAFEKMKYSEPVESIAAEIKPQIEYYESLIPKYVGKKRKMRKMRYTSYYNIALLYYYLDMTGKSIEYANKLIENDHQKSNGKRIISISNNLNKSFEKNKVKTRHMKVLTENNTID